MKIVKNIFLYTIILCFLNADLKAQCNTNTNICSAEISGPFNFSTPGQPVSSCLDFWGPGYAYISLYITPSGPLEMLINGNASLGFLDVAIFNVPAGSDPCNAIQDNSNQISCNYAIAASGCNQIGGFFGCPSYVSSPDVNIGDRLMIVVENWSGSSTEFTLELAPAPAAQSGPGDPTIDPILFSLDEASSPYQMTAIDNGGIWSGTGVSGNGLFNPATTGPGTFLIRYTLGTGPCLTKDSTYITVNTALAIELIDLQINCKDNQKIMKWTTTNEINCDYFKVERSFDAQNYTNVGIIKGNGNSSETLNYTFVEKKNEGQQYYRLVEVDFNGKETIYGPIVANCKEKKELSIYPNPVKDYLQIQLPEFDDVIIKHQIISITGKKITSILHNNAIDISNLSAGYYMLSIETQSQKYIQKFIHQ